MIRPSEDLALYRADMAGWESAVPGQLPGWRASRRDWVRANDACRRDILDRLGSAGPLPSRELPDTCKVPWRSTGWTNNRNVTQLLELMVGRGEVAIAGRRAAAGCGTWRLGSTPTTRWSRRTRRDASATSGGCGRSASPGPGDPNTRSSRSTWRRRASPPWWRASRNLAGRSVPAGPAVLGPCGAVVALRPAAPRPQAHRRALRVRLPAGDVQARRQAPLGYFALPILYGDQLVGKLDATADRKAGMLRVDAVHEDVPFDGP